MNNNQLDNNTKRKRKRNRRKNKTWKRSKFQTTRIFRETSFDSSDENEVVLVNESPSKRSADSVSYNFENVVNLTPSKSESDKLEPPEAESVVFDNETDVSCVLSEQSFFMSSDPGSSYLYNSISEEFFCNGGSSDTEIVSAQIEGLEDTRTKTEEKKKREKPKSIVRAPETLSDKKESENGAENCSSDQTTTLFNQEAQCHNTDDGILVVLRKNETLYFHGLCLLFVLHGQVEVLGHILTKNSSDAKLYSPRGSSLLYLRNVTESDVAVTTYLLTNISKNIKLSEKCAIVLCKKLNDPDVLFTEKHISQQILPKQIQNYVRVVFQPKEGQWNLLRVNKKWNDILDTVKKNSKLIICGGKGVGKTTLLRYAINRLLMKFKKVRVVDLDPGQSEFTVPGCISLVTIDKPVFGVNYTHLQKSERSILSNINIAYEPDKYVASVKYLLNTNLDEVPTLINYMGFTHGIGINILSAVITTVQPTDVIQICSQNSRKNYKVLLNTDVVKHNAKLFIAEDGDLSYNLYQVESMCDQNDAWTAEPRQLREMCTLAYISQMIKSDSIFTSRAPIYRISLSDIIISDLKQEKLHPAAVNACLVALCALESEFFQCFSWGVVRGVDLDTKELVLLTNESEETLNKVTHLVSSGVTLPPSIYMTPDEVKGPMPYVIEGVLMSFGHIPKRSRISAKSVN